MVKLTRDQLSSRAIVFNLVRMKNKENSYSLGHIDSTKEDLFYLIPPLFIIFLGTLAKEAKTQESPHVGKAVYL